MAPVFRQTPIAAKPSLGAQLKTLRLKRRLSLAAAEHETKIRAHYLATIEADDPAHLPHAHAKGFVRRYATFLGLETDAIEAVLRQLDWPSERGNPFSPVRLQRLTSWVITPKLVASLGLILVLIGFIGYVVYQVRRFAAPPSLVIVSPPAQSVVDQDTITVTGKTDPGALVTVADFQATVGEDGTFANPVSLRPGLNRVSVRAENGIKKSSTQTVSVLYAPTSPLTETATPLASPAP